MTENSRELSRTFALGKNEPKLAAMEDNWICDRAAYIFRQFFIYKTANEECAKDFLRAVLSVTVSTVSRLGTV